MGRKKYKPLYKVFFKLMKLKGYYTGVSKLAASKIRFSLVKKFLNLKKEYKGNFDNLSLISFPITNKAVVKDKIKTSSSSTVLIKPYMFFFNFLFLRLYVIRNLIVRLLLQLNSGLKNFKYCSFFNLLVANYNYHYSMIFGDGILEYTSLDNPSIIRKNIILPKPFFFVKKIKKLKRKIYFY
jgi:hypothetical protein